MKDRQKMCLNCDARIPLSAGECPFCGAECAEATIPQQTDAPIYKHQALQDSLTALYAPPYSAKSTTPPSSPVHEEMTKPAPAASFSKPFQEVAVEKKTTAQPLPQAALPAEEEEGKNIFWPLLLLSGGTTLLTLGLLQFFFSDQGVLKLEWDSTYWLLYCFAAAPLVYFGYKKASQLK